jgi:hypothetical protein
MTAPFLPSTPPLPPIPLPLLPPHFHPQLNNLGVIQVFANSVGGQLSTLHLPWMPLFGLLHLAFFTMHYFFASQTAHVGALYSAFCAMMLGAGEMMGPQNAHAACSYARIHEAFAPSQPGLSCRGFVLALSTFTLSTGPSCPPRRTASLPTPLCPPPPPIACRPAGVPPVLAAITLAYSVNIFGSLTHYASGQAAAYYGSGFMKLNEVFAMGAINGFLGLFLWATLGMPCWKALGWF